LFNILIILLNKCIFAVLNLLKMKIYTLASKQNLPISKKEAFLIIRILNGSNQFLNINDYIQPKQIIN
jgi:hypothetical protein